MSTGRLLRPEDQRWKAFLATVPHDVYHTPGYVAADARRNDAEALAYLYASERGSLAVPLLVRRCAEALGPAAGDALDAVSPYGYPGFLLDAAALERDGFVDEALDDLIATLAEDGVVTAFLRMHPILNEGIEALASRHRVEPRGVTVVIDVTQTDAERWAAMRKGHTNAINQAKRAGMTTSVVPLAGHIADFVVVYGEVLQRLDASRSYHFDKTYLEELARDPSVWLIRAHLDDELTGAYILFEHDGVVHPHLGGARNGYHKPSPSNLLIHATCQWAQLRGNRLVHLGGGVGASADDSLFRFKSGFSPSRRTFHTVSIVADRARLDRLTEVRARALGVDPHSLAQNDFFPPYRSAPSPPRCPPMTSSEQSMPLPSFA